MPLDQLHDPAEAVMSFGDHLDELRTRLLMAIVPPLPLAILIFLVSRQLVELLCVPLRRALEAVDMTPQLQALSPPEMILVRMKLSIIAALIIAAPWVLYQVWLFVRPGLYAAERRFVYFLLPGSAILTFAGIALLYFAMLPLVLTVLVGFGTDDAVVLERPEDPAFVAPELPSMPVLEERPAWAEPGSMWVFSPENRLEIAVQRGDRTLVLHMPLLRGALVSQNYRLREYINFVLLLAMGMSIAFQMPLVIVLLGWLDLVRVGWLKQHRKHAVFVCAIISMFITPADAVSMMAMLLPLYGLFELGIILLVLAPASRVSGGGVFRRPWSHKADPAPGQSGGPAGSDAPSEGADETSDSDAPPDDGGGGPA